MKHIIKKTLLLLTALIAVLALTACGSKTEIDLAQYVHVNVSGADGYGYATADVDNIGLEALLLADDESDADSWIKLDLLMRISYGIPAVHEMIPFEYIEGESVAAARRSL